MPVPSGPQLVEGLDPELPLALFPVRLATRFHRGDGPKRPLTELRVRIFPDVIGADAHLPRLTRLEGQQGRAYWARLASAGDDQVARDEAHRWLVGQLCAPRAAWVAQATASGKEEDRPDGDGVSSTEAPSTRPTLARLLPDRWRVTLRAGHGEYHVRTWSKPIRRPLAMAPNLADIPESGDVIDLLRAQDMGWMVDYDEAVEIGMAVTLPLDTIPANQPIERVVVWGVRADDDPSEAELAAALDAHRFTTGLEFIAQGTPTNNTETVESGFTETPADLEAWFARQLAEPTVSRPTLTGNPARLGLAAAADATALAFGLDRTLAVDHCELAADRAGDRASAMNRALYPATIGYLLSQMLATDGKPAITGAELRWVRDWFRDWVRGGGFLPTLRVGGQPYGVLPVARLETQWFQEPTNRIDAISYVLHQYSSWADSLGTVASFADRRNRTPEQEAVDLAAVLGAVPHPIGFRLREAEDAADRLASEWNDDLAELERTIHFETFDTYWTHDYLDNGHAGSRQDLITNGPISDQSYALSGMRDIGEDYLDMPAYQDVAEGLQSAIDQINEIMLARTTAHKSRAETRAFESNFSEAHLPTSTDPPLWYVEYGDDGAQPDGSYPKLRIVPGGGPKRVAAILRDLADDFRAVTEETRPSYRAQRADALLRKIVEHGVEQVAVEATADPAAGLDRLVEMVEDGEVPGPLEELERLCRETLGLAGYRQDAWLSSIAAQRLATIRAKRPTGIQIGGYGWVVNPQPDDVGPDTRGFIHAPSLDHAATGAVLRSAWLAFTNQDSDAPFSINLSSDRVRRARWLLEGVGNGIELGELLGARFERRLHDTGQSELIDDVRSLALEAAGEGQRPDSAIVDGLAIAVAVSPSTGPNSLRRALLDLRRSLPGFPDDRLEPVLAETVADIDAVADLLMAQSVHGVLKGNLAQAAAALSASGAGDAGIPDMRVADVHREAQLVTNRVVAVLGTGTTAPSTLLAAAEPALAEWLGAIMARFGRVGVTVRFGDEVRSLPLEDTGLGPAEIVGLCPVGGDIDSSPLVSVLEALARHRLGIDAGTTVTITGTGDGGDGPATLGELVVAAGALRSAIGLARPLHADDLAHEPGAGPRVDLGELLGRLDATVQWLTGLSEVADMATSLAAVPADWVAVDPVAAVAALNALADQAAEPTPVEALRLRAVERRDALQAPWPDGYDQLDDAGRAGIVAERLQGCLPLAIGILPRFQPADPSALAASVTSSARRLGSPTAAAAWLVQSGRVHPGAGAIAEAITLAEAVAGRPLADWTMAQLPDIERERWAAIERPTDREARTCLFSITTMDGAVGGGTATGLVFDGWSEVIPGPTATTGVAFHFDKPGAQAPQAVLLATGPTDGGWTVGEIRTILDQTLDLATTRAVGPETLQDWGHTLPAVYLKGRVAVTAVADDDGGASDGGVGS